MQEAHEHRITNAAESKENKKENGVDAQVCRSLTVSSFFFFFAAQNSCFGVSFNSILTFNIFVYSNLPAAAVPVLFTFGA